MLRRTAEDKRGLVSVVEGDLDGRVHARYALFDRRQMFHGVTDSIHRSWPQVDPRVHVAE